jgi:hypothetical protein
MQREQLAINSVTTRQAAFEEALAAFSAAGFRPPEVLQVEPQQGATRVA